MKPAKRQYGVWLDTRKAYILELRKDDFIIIESDIEEYNPKGGYGSQVPYQFQDATSESTYLERKKQQEKKYFSHIISELQNADEIVLMGPAETRKHLEKAINENNKLQGKVEDNLPLDSLTENQIRAQIKEYFSVH
jgi:stalled ribosome rescue protein Dom34